jgi:hypothetical protein
MDRVETAKAGIPLASLSPRDRRRTPTHPFVAGLVFCHAKPVTRRETVMADIQSASFAVHRKFQRATVTFEDQRVVVQTDQARVTFPNPTPIKGRRRYHPCNKHCLRLVDQAFKAIERRKIEQEQTELAKQKDHCYA